MFINHGVLKKQLSDKYSFINQTINATFYARLKIKITDKKIKVIICFIYLTHLR